jgi:hypothetical protein
MLVLTLPLAPFSAAGRWGLALVVGSYAAANLAASALTAQRADIRLLPQLIVAFATLHLSYGLGFLVGIVRFWNRWGTKTLFAVGAPGPVPGQNAVQ